MRLVDDVELVVVPARPLGAFVRAVADRDRLLPERLARVGRVEDELDHLPVALVGVVEVVERVEEPVLEGKLAGAAGFRRDVRVHGGFAALGQAPRPAFVVAAGVERVAGEVEVVLEAIRTVLGPRADRPEVGATPGAAQRNRRLVLEQEVDVERVVRLARSAALLLLFDQPYDRGEPLGQRRLVGEVGARDRGHDERSREQRGERNPAQTASASAHRSEFDPTSSNPAGGSLRTHGLRREQS